MMLIMASLPLRVQTLFELLRQAPGQNLFPAGAVSWLVAGSAARWGWQYAHYPDPLVSGVQQSQTKMALNALLNRYMLTTLSVAHVRLAP